jgi:hypothetical protein
MQGGTSVKHYVYCPFETAQTLKEVGQADGAVLSANKRYQTKYGSKGNNSNNEATKGLVIPRSQPLPTSPDVGPLRTKPVLPNDLLIINCHGNPDMEHVDRSSASGQTIPGVECFAGQQWNGQMTANDFAMLLQMEGLHPNHVLIKMIVCFSGGKLATAGAGITRDATVTSYFGKLLAVALGSRGFANVVVGGYPNAILTPSETRRQIKREDGVVPEKRDGGSWNQTKARIEVGGKAKDVGVHDHIVWVNAQGQELSAAAAKALKAQIKGL